MKVSLLSRMKIRLLYMRIESTISPDSARSANAAHSIRSVIKISETLRDKIRVNQTTGYIMKVSLLIRMKIRLLYMRIESTISPDSARSANAAHSTRSVRYSLRRPTQYIKN